MNIKTKEVTLKSEVIEAGFTNEQKDTHNALINNGKHLHYTFPQEGTFEVTLKLKALEGDCLEINVNSEVMIKAFKLKELE